MKYHARLVEIEAVRWWPPGHHLHAPIAGVETGPRGDQGAVLVEQNRVTDVRPGDWIITTDKVRMVMPAALFEALYRPFAGWTESVDFDGSVVSLPDGHTYRPERSL